MSLSVFIRASPVVSPSSAVPLASVVIRVHSRFPPLPLLPAVPLYLGSSICVHLRSSAAEAVASSSVRRHSRSFAFIRGSRRCFFFPPFPCLPSFPSVFIRGSPILLLLLSLPPSSFASSASLRSTFPPQPPITPMGNHLSPHRAPRRPQGARRENPHPSHPAHSPGGPLHRPRRLQHHPRLRQRPRTPRQRDTGRVEAGFRLQAPGTARRPTDIHVIPSPDSSGRDTAAVVGILTCSAGFSFQRDRNSRLTTKAQRPRREKQSNAASLCDLGVLVVKVALSYPFPSFLGP